MTTTTDQPDNASVIHQMRKQTPMGQIAGGILASVAYEGMTRILAVDDPYIRAALIVGVAPTTILAAAIWVSWRFRRAATRTLVGVLTLVTALCFAPLILTLAALIATDARDPTGSLWLTIGIDTALGLTVATIAITIQQREVKSDNDPRIERAQVALQTFLGIDDERPPSWALELAHSINQLNNRLDSIEIAEPARRRRFGWLRR